MIDRLISSSTLCTPNGTFFFHIYEVAADLHPVYRWDCLTDFTSYSVRSRLFPTYQQALMRADRERCFFAEVWATSEGQGWLLIDERVAA